MHDILLEELSLIFGFPTYAVPKISALFCNLPDIHVIKEDTKSNEDNQEQDVLPVTHFRAINETNSQRRSSTKFERINKNDSESSDDDRYY